MPGRIVVYVILVAAALAAPFLGLYPVFLMKLLCFAMFACAFNLLLGYTKMLSFGHAAYFGSSAYITGWLITVHGWGTVQGILAGVAAAMLLGLAIGAIAVRRQGIYFAMITLALAQLVFFVCLQADFTGGENGLQGIPRGSVFGMLNLALLEAEQRNWLKSLWWRLKAGSSAFLIALRDRRDMRLRGG